MRDVDIYRIEWFDGGKKAQQTTTRCVTKAVCNFVRQFCGACQWGGYDLIYTLNFNIIDDDE